MHVDVQQRQVETRAARQWIISGFTAAQINKAMEKKKEHLKEVDKLKGRSKLKALPKVIRAQHEVFSLVDQAIGHTIVSYEVFSDRFKATGEIIVKESVDKIPSVKEDGFRATISGEQATKIAELATKRLELNRRKKEVDAEEDAVEALMWEHIFDATGKRNDGKISLQFDPSRFSETGEVAVYEDDDRHSGLGALLARSILGQ